MTAKRWDFQDEDLRPYSVEVEHNVLSGDRRIIVNGREVFRGGKFSEARPVYERLYALTDALTSGR